MNPEAPKTQCRETKDPKKHRNSAQRGPRSTWDPQTCQTETQGPQTPPKTGPQKPLKYNLGTPPQIVSHPQDAKRDEVVRKAYKYLAALHEVNWGGGIDFFWGGGREEPDFGALDVQ